MTLPRFAPIPGTVKPPHKRRKGEATPADFATCAMKRVYESKQEAKAKGFGVYRCPACGKFHRRTDKRYVKKR